MDFFGMVWNFYELLPQFDWIKQEVISYIAQWAKLATLGSVLISVKNIFIKSQKIFWKFYYIFSQKYFGQIKSLFCFKSSNASIF